jgi:hypothetical protein
LAVRACCRIDLFRRPPPGSLSAASSPRGDHFDLFHSAKAISAKTFQSYGMPDLARLWARPITLEPPPPTCLVPRQTGRGAGAKGSKHGGDKRKIDATVSAVMLQ